MKTHQQCQGISTYCACARLPEVRLNCGAPVQATISKAVCWGTAAATLLAAGNASAAQEIAELAGADNRLGIIATLFLPVVGWVRAPVACLAGARSSRVRKGQSLSVVLWSWQGLARCPGGTGTQMAVCRWNSADVLQTGCPEVCCTCCSWCLGNGGAGCPC